MDKRTQFYIGDDPTESLAEVISTPQKFMGRPFANEHGGIERDSVVRGTDPDRQSADLITGLLPPGLQVIATRSASGRLPAGWRVRRPLTLDDLEMLEAELVNQGVMTPPANTEAVDGLGYAVFSVSQRAAFEIASLRWRARRLSRNKEFRFVIDVPRYLLNWAKELLNSPAMSPTRSESSNGPRFHGREIKPLLSRFSEHAVTADMRAVQGQLRYLELFAQYIIGIEENVRSASRDRGLEVVLKALSDPVAQSFHCPVSLTAVLPMNDGGRWLGLS